MLKYLVLTTLIANSAHCFDPFTALAVGDSIKDGLDKADEVADIGFSLTDLLSELGVETDSEQDLEAAVSRLHKLNSDARDLKWQNESLNQNIELSLNKGTSLSRRIKAMRNTIRTSKRLAEIMGFRPKAAEKAARVQDLKLNSMMLEELQSIRRAQYLAILEDKESKIRRDLILEKLVEDAKEKQLDKQGNRNHSTKVGGS